MKRLPMGLKISPSAFSRMMTIALAGLNYEKCFVYLDDVIVFGRNLNQHNKNLMSVLERLRRVNLRLNPQKCQFLRKSVLYLGHKISENEILPDPEKIKVVKSYPTPTNADETRRFVAFANYYRKFIQNFSLIAQPLNKLSRKNVEFFWSQECNSAFEELKEKLASPQVLDYPDFSEENTFQLTTDASKIGLGAVLANGNGRPVAFTSRVLNKQEKNYSTTEIEILAIVWALKHYRPYLYGRHFIVHTDHKPLVYLFSQIDPSSRLCKFKTALMGYDFEIKYVKGQNNVVADALSRITLDELVELSNQVNNSSILVVARAQQRNNDNKIGKIEGNKEQGQRTDHTEEPINEILKRPKGATLVKRYVAEDGKIFDKYKKISLSRALTVTYIVETSTIYLVFPHSEARLERVSVLQDLVKLCGHTNIKELVIMKNEENREIIGLLKDIKKI
jgi:RNase H-like domain found in reverse transcriptase/Reverse transcriptase (RNA-dependent DNA polymerase)